MHVGRIIKNGQVKGIRRREHNVAQRDGIVTLSIFSHLDGQVEQVSLVSANGFPIRSVAQHTHTAAGYVIAHENGVKRQAI